MLWKSIYITESEITYVERLGLIKNIDIITILNLWWKILFSSWVINAFSSILRQKYIVRKVLARESWEELHLQWYNPTILCVCAPHSDEFALHKFLFLRLCVRLCFLSVIIELTSFSKHYQKHNCHSSRRIVSTRCLFDPIIGRVVSLKN